MIRRMVVYLGMAVAGFLVTGCSQGDFATAKVSGVVTCEGTPVAKAMVYFEPLGAGQQTGATVGKQGFSFTDDSGRYVLSTYGNQDGAVVGKHRVRVGGPEAKCNCSLNEENTLMEVEVKAGEANVFDIALPPATPADRARAAMNSEDD